MKRGYNKVNVEALTPMERRKYKKHLAYVRRYTQERRRWLKQIKAGKLHPSITLDQYRAAKQRSFSKATAQKGKVEEAIMAVKGMSTTDEMINILQRLTAEVTKHQEQEKALLEKIKKIGS